MAVIWRNYGALVLWGFVAVLVVLAGTTHIFAGTVTFSDDGYVADDLEVDGSADVAGALVVGGTISCSGNALVTGNLEVSGYSEVVESVTYEGNLPTASDHTGQLYRNTVGDSLWYADDDSWNQLVP